jgi:Ca2+-binding EF-hand superfamily protein
MPSNPRKSIANSFNRMATILEIPPNMYMRTKTGVKNTSLKELVTEEMIFEQIQRLRWTLLMDRMPRDEVNRLLFDQYASDHGEETSIKDFHNILLQKFNCLTKEDALNVARFLMETPAEAHHKSVVFNIELKVQNRKITQMFTEKILGPGYEAISEKEEVERVEKLRKQVKGHGLTPQDVETALDLYDPDERGYISMKDLYEWLESLELIKDDDEEDKLLQIIVMYVYKKTNMAS